MSCSKLDDESASTTSGFSDTSIARRLRTFGDDMVLPFLPPVSGILFLKIQTCEVCTHKSHEPNPIKDRTIPGFDWPTWPWASGTSIDPVGKRCSLCPWAHKIAGYNESLKDLVAVLRGSFENRRVCHVREGSCLEH